MSLKNSYFFILIIQILGAEGGHYISKSLSEHKKLDYLGLDFYLNNITETAVDSLMKTLNKID